MNESATQVLRRVAPAWAWVRENFKLPALLTIAGLVAAGGGFFWHQHMAIVALEGRPDLGPQLAGLAARLDADERADLAAGYERRIAIMEGYWAEADRIARERASRRH